MSGRMRRVAPALLVGAAFAVVPGAAFAGEAHVDGDTVVYDGYAGENNAVEVGQVDGLLKTDIIIHDTTGVDRGDGCSFVNVTTVSCGVSTLGQIPHVELNLGNLNDSAKPAFVNPVDTFMEINGGLGNDTLTGGTDIDTIDGGDGNDHVSGAGAADKLYGYLGTDTIDGDDGADTIDGGAGDDDLNGDAGADTISGAAGADELHGGLDGDTLNGNAGQDKLFGEAGKDKFFGGTEADKLFASDDQNETVDCGSGWFANDTADINDGDNAIDCESTP